MIRLLLVLLEGQLYLAGIFAVFAAELGFLLWGLWSRRPIVGLVAVFVAVPLMRSTLSTIRGCFFLIPAPDGLQLDRSNGNALYALVDEIGRAVDSPPVDTIVITRSFGASAMVYSLPWRFRRRRTLALGFPMLTTLSAAELRAVIAHELAHFSGAHDAFAAWVYRTRRAWIEVRTALDRRLATPLYVYWLLRWYVPRLNSASAEVGRGHELVADRIAAQVAGSRAAADALAVVETGTRFAEDTYWPPIWMSAESASAPPRPYTGMLTWNARTTSIEVLDALLAFDTAPDDTHPSLRERFDRLGEPARLPPHVERSAGHDLLGGALAELAERLDQEWASHHGEEWHERRHEYLEQRSELDRLTAIDAPSADEMFRRAALIESLEAEDDALPLYQRAAEQGHAAASLAAGRLLLDRFDRTGIAMIEAAMDHDESLVPSGCRILQAHYRETGQALAARKCEWRAERHAARKHLRHAPTAANPTS